MLFGYDGYEWGWIVEGGMREASDGTSKALPSQIIGVWGRVFRNDIGQQYYRETYLSEYKKESEQKNSWTERPLTMLLNLNMSQCLKFAYPESHPVAEEMMSIPDTVYKRFKALQTWECMACSHTFYTEPMAKLPIMEIVKRIVTLSPVYIECPVCHEVKAKKAGKIKREIRE